MKKVKTFFHDFLGSLFPQPPYYHKLLRTPFSVSVKYFLVLVLLVNFVFFAVSGLMVKNGRFVTFKRLTTALADFPDNLSIHMENGMLTTSYDHPYFIWTKNDENKMLLGVIDENALPDKIQEYPTDVLLTRQALVIKQAEQPEVIPYGSATFTVNKQTVASFLNVIETVRPVLYLLIGLFVFVLFPLFTFGAGLLYLAFLSLICFLIFKLYTKRHTYKKTLQLSLHAVTVPIIVKHGLFLSGYDVERLGILFMLLSAVFILGALYEAYQDH